MARLLELRPDGFRGGLMGIEKESLRMGTDGIIARTPHPVSLGSALMNPWITTDYSEALLELITPPFVGPEPALDFLAHLQQFVYQRLDDELLWAMSMPCMIRSARSESRRWMRVTFEAKFVRNSASSTAVLPPPITATARPR